MYLIHDVLIALRRHIIRLSLVPFPTFRFARKTSTTEHDNSTYHYYCGG